MRQFLSDSERNGEGLGGTEINLPFWEVNFKDGDAEGSACAVDFSGAATEEGSASGVEGEKISSEGGDMD